MLHTFIEFVLLSWASYCLLRVAFARSNAIQVGAEVVARCPNDFAFQTYMKVKEYYLQLSPGHKKYEIHGKNITQDAVIEVWEKAGFQFVQHLYKVTELVPRERMKLVSEVSQVKIFGFIKSQSRSEVEFRFQSASNTESNLGLTIRIIFQNRMRHFLARLSFTQSIWQSHAKEEMTALAKIIEQRYAEKSA